MTLAPAWRTKALAPKIPNALETLSVEVRPAPGSLEGTAAVSCAIGSSPDIRVIAAPTSRAMPSAGTWRETVMGMVTGASVRTI